MLRVRTFFQNSGLTFNPNPLRFEYGTQINTTETQYGIVVGYNSITTLDSKNFYTLNGGGAYNTKEATISFKTTTANQKINVEIRASSQTGDYMCCGNLDSNSITVAAAKVDGTATKTYTYTVATAGNHYIKFFFRNDGSGTGNQNKGYFRMEPFTNFVKGLGNVTKSVEVKSCSDWSFYSKSDWIVSITPNDGKKGKTNCNVTVQPNYGDVRTGQIIVQDKKKKKLYTLQVIQEKGPSELKLSNNYIVVNDDNVTGDITVSLSGTSTTWTADNTSGTWYTVSPSSGGDNANVKVTWKANTSTQHQAQVKFRGNNGGEDTLTIVQEQHICSCECVSWCSCDINVDCPSDYTNECTCDTVTSCTCDYVCQCNNNRNICDLDQPYCASDYEGCSGYSSGCTSESCSRYTMTCSCQSYKCSEGFDCTCNNNTCSSDGQICSRDTECSCYSQQHCPCNTKKECSCETNKCSCNTQSCSGQSEICDCNTQTCSCNDDVCSCNKETVKCTGDCCLCNKETCNCDWEETCTCQYHCSCNTDYCSCYEDTCTQHRNGGTSCLTQYSPNGHCGCHNYNGCAVDGAGCSYCNCNSVQNGWLCECEIVACPAYDSCHCESVCKAVGYSCTCEHYCSCNSKMYPCECETVCNCNNDTTCSCNTDCTCNSNKTCTCDDVCKCQSNVSCSCQQVLTCPTDKTTCSCNDDYYCTCENVCYCDGNMTCVCEHICNCHGDGTECLCDTVCNCQYDNSLCSCNGVCRCQYEETCTCNEKCVCNQNIICTCDDICKCDKDAQMTCTCETKQVTTNCTTELRCPYECTTDHSCSCNNYQAVN